VGRSKRKQGFLGEWSGGVGLVGVGAVRTNISPAVSRKRGLCMSGGMLKGGGSIFHVLRGALSVALEKKMVIKRNGRRELQMSRADRSGYWGGFVKWLVGGLKGGVGRST